MTPNAFLQQLKKGPPAAAYLLVGDELFHRDHCRKALIQAVLGDAAAGDGPPEGLIEHDLAERSLAAMLDDARTVSLFSPKRLIVGYRAEAALPKRLGSDSEPGAEDLARYLTNPSSGVVLLFESTRFNWADRDDKARNERVVKFFSAVKQTVELQRFGPGEALSTAATLAKRAGLNIENDALADLVEILGADMARIASNIEKLALYAGGQRRIGGSEIEMLVPEARQSGMFEFSDALAGNDRQRALELLDTLAKSGSYWPIQISLLAGLFRQALAAKEQGARSQGDVTRVFGKLGIRVWPARARQAGQMASRFSQPQLEKALCLLSEADRDLRRERPDDRIVMEQLVIGMTN
jgi:DNA polymerase-3 subunit delta